MIVMKSDNLLAHEKENFVINGTCDKSLIRSTILQSWIRSRNAGVNPVILNKEVLLENELSDKLKENKILLSVATHYIEKIYSFVKGSNFAVSLSDKNGYVLKVIGDDDIIRNSNEYSAFRAGANRNELHFGTNAIGTCISINEPLQICGSEHYVKVLDIYTCSAAPIHDEFNNVIGCLNLTGPKENVQSHTLGMVVAAVDGIEKELKIINAYNKIHIINNQLSTTLNSMDSAIILLSADGKILNINKVALNIFNLDLELCIEKKINEVIDYDINKINFEKIRNNYKDVELEIKNIKYNVSISSYNDRFEKSDGYVITIKEMKHIHKMVKKYSGFTAAYTIDNIVGQSAQITYVKNLCLKAAKSSSNVLILGESGTGKELVAQSIHNASSRSKEPFIAINCGALPKGLIESELFGYEGGSFTGASKEGKPGKFELADGGTIFLDEIGDMPLDTQVSLLRVLQTKQIVRIGGSRPKTIDVRVIAATNKDLYDNIHNNSFRNDLYYRLNVFTITVPPLKNRVNDLKILLNHFISHYNTSLNKKVKKINEKATEILSNYSWPGNVRELENVLERAINIVDADTITEKDLPSYLWDLSNSHLSKSKNIIEKIRMNVEPYPYEHSEQITDKEEDNNNNNNNEHKADNNPLLLNRKSELEKDEIIKSLRLYEGCAAQTAKYLGISRRTLYRKLEKYAISIDCFRTK